MTRFLSPDGVGETVDYMPVKKPPPWQGDHQLIRRVTAVRGSMAFRVTCRPAFNYARDRHEVNLCPGQGACFHSPALSLELTTRVPLREDRGGVAAEFTIKEGESAVFRLQQVPRGQQCSEALKPSDADLLFQHTLECWRRWIAGCSYAGCWREIVRRSALVLKLLTFEPTGAIVAAPTCSLPEAIGGERNWDYRYTWIRDAAFTLYALMRIGFTHEAFRFISWLEARCHERGPDGALQVLYRIDGGHKIGEETLGHLEGYRSSSPVRIGNAAHGQLQLDIYGELLDSVYLYNKYGTPISYELWNELRQLLDYVCDNWQKPDCGVWEIRGRPRRFVYSRVMSWVALDRGLRLADKRSLPGDRERWTRDRDAIYEEILKRGWSTKRKSFVQHYHSTSLDAANLIMPLVFFMSPTDPRMIRTLEATRRSPSEGGLVSDSLVRRYNTRSGIDGLEGEEGTFNMCTFWLVEALTRAARTDRRRLDEARLIFEKMIGYANHLGLYSEQTGPCGEALGNFPQALTHLALISAAHNLDRALQSAEGDWPGLPTAR